MSIEAKAVTVAVIGGTGKEGSGLAFRWANAGYKVIIGSRTPDKAEQAANELNAQLSGVTVQGMGNEQAAQQSGWVVLTVPYSAHKSTLESIKTHVQGKVLIDVTVPIVPPNFMTPTLPAGRTAAEEAQSLVGTSVKVVSAFQNVSAVHLKDLSHAVSCDVLVASDDADAKQSAIALAEAAGMRGVDIGPLANAIVSEALTPVLLGINKRYGVKGAGIKITELD